jgi:hypothetical protein
MLREIEKKGSMIILGPGLQIYIIITYVLIGRYWRGLENELTNSYWISPGPKIIMLPFFSISRSILFVCSIDAVFFQFSVTQFEYRNKSARRGAQFVPIGMPTTC